MYLLGRVVGTGKLFFIRYSDPRCHSYVVLVILAFVCTEITITRKLFEVVKVGNRKREISSDQ